MRLKIVYSPKPRFLCLHTAAHSSSESFIIAERQGNEKRVELNTDRVNHWVSQGAQLTDKVRMLVKEASSQAAA